MLFCFDYFFEMQHYHLIFCYKLRVRTGPGKPWKIFEALETLEKPWNFFMKPWKISQNFILTKINSSKVHFPGSTISIWSHWPFGTVTVKIYWPRFKEYWPGQKSKEANSNSDGCVSTGILPYWIWISMCMANVILASWFPAGACLYCNMWSYYFRTLNGFSLGKYFFQSYFPWQKRFNK